jgi:hypothetical protein
MKDTEKQAKERAKPTSDSERTAKPSDKHSEFSKVLWKSMVVFGGVFRQDFHPLTIRAYAVALQSLSPRLLRLACERALTECKFMPVPAEILDFAETVREQSPALPPLQCKICDGCGWRSVPRPDGTGCWAVRCDHHEVETSEEESVEPCLENDAAMATLREIVGKTEIPKPMTETELDARKEVLSEQARRIRLSHPGPISPPPDRAPNELAREITGETIVSGDGCPKTSREG